jgi:8-oxo-dGTP diphosphatase
VRWTFPDGVRYLIVHPSGAYNRGKPWSIAKGLPNANEDLEACAIRETIEETGIACRIVRPLGSIRYVKSRKTVYGFLAEPVEPPASEALPPCSWEVDCVEFCRPEDARERLHPDQRVFIDRAEEEA